MAGSRDDGTFAEDKAHHPNRKVARIMNPRHTLPRVVDAMVKGNQVWNPNGELSMYSADSIAVANHINNYRRRRDEGKPSANAFKDIMNMVREGRRPEEERKDEQMYKHEQEDGDFYEHETSWDNDRRRDDYRGRD